MNNQRYQVIQESDSPWVPWGRHTELLLITANEQSTAPGGTWGLTLKPGFDCLKHIFRLFG